MRYRNLSCAGGPCVIFLLTHSKARFHGSKLVGFQERSKMTRMKLLDLFLKLGLLSMSCSETLFKQVCLELSGDVIKSNPMRTPGRCHKGVCLLSLDPGWTKNKISVMLTATFTSKEWRASRISQIAAPLDTVFSCWKCTFVWKTRCSVTVTTAKFCIRGPKVWNQSRHKDKHHNSSWRPL